MVLTNSMAFAPSQHALSHANMGRMSEPAPISAADAQAQRLAAAIGRGDDAAFQEFYDLYHGRLFRLLLVLSQGQETLAHEVVQLTMLQAAAKLKRVQAEAHLWHWLARAGRQLLIKQWRRRNRQPELVTVAELPEAANDAEPDHLLEESLDQALLTLGTEERELVEWFYFDGLSQKQIAERLDTTPKAVSSRLERTRTKLRSFLGRLLSHES